MSAERSGGIRAAWKRDDETRPLTDTEVARMEKNLLGDGPSFAIQAMDDARRLLAVVRSMKRRERSMLTIIASHGSAFMDLDHEAREAARANVCDAMEMIVRAAVRATWVEDFATASKLWKATQSIHEHMVAGNVFSALCIAEIATADAHGDPAEPTGDMK